MTQQPLIPPAAVAVAHGWTAEDLHQAAALAVRQSFSRAADPADQYAAAWSAAAEHLVAAGTPPERGEVLRAARTAVAALTQANRQSRGLSRASGFTVIHGAFARYWWQPPLSGWEDAVVDRIALGQVWDAITPAHRSTLRALADCGGDQEGAAKAVGASYVTYQSRLRDARRAFRELWHEGETPPGKFRRDRLRYRRESADAA